METLILSLRCGRGMLMGRITRNQNSSAVRDQCLRHTLSDSVHGMPIDSIEPDIERFTGFNRLVDGDLLSELADWILCFTFRRICIAYSGCTVIEGGPEDIAVGRRLEGYVRSGYVRRDIGRYYAVDSNPFV